MRTPAHALCLAHAHAVSVAFLTRTATGKAVAALMFRENRWHPLLLLLLLTAFIVGGIAAPDVLECGTVSIWNSEAFPDCEAASAVWGQRARLRRQNFREENRPEVLAPRAVSKNLTLTLVPSPPSSFFNVMTPHRHRNSQVLRAHSSWNGTGDAQVACCSVLLYIFVTLWRAQCNGNGHIVAAGTFLAACDCFWGWDGIDCGQPFATPRSPRGAVIFMAYGEDKYVPVCFCSRVGAV